MTKTHRATEAKMSAVDERLAARLRSRGWVVVRVADPDHLYREFNDHDNTCHAPGCELAIQDHLNAELAAELAELEGPHCSDECAAAGTSRHIPACPRGVWIRGQ